MMLSRRRRKRELQCTDSDVYEHEIKYPNHVKIKQHTCKNICTFVCL
jgi:hypothetical protein